MTVALNPSENEVALPKVQRHRSRNQKKCHSIANFAKKLTLDRVPESNGVACRRASRCGWAGDRHSGGDDRAGRFTLRGEDK